MAAVEQWCRFDMTLVRSRIRDAFQAALDAAQPESVVRRKISTTDAGEVKIDGKSVGHDPRVDVIAIGKAGVPSMAGALAGLGGAVSRGFVITKVGHVDRALPEYVQVHEAAHPVLDERSVYATRQLLDWVSGISPDTVVLCLISGGGSALLEAPVAGVSLDDFQTMTRLLLHAGADIHQLNAVRSQLSRVKGGGLRAAIPAKTVVTLALSDVLGNDPTVIASGPTVSLNTTHREAREILSQLGLTEHMPESVRRVLATDDRERAEAHPGDHVTVIADNELALAAASEQLRTMGLRVVQGASSRTGEARDVALEWVRALKDVPADVEAVLAGGELTVTVTGNGIGGRNTEFALAAALELERLGIDDWTVASLATDGDDGPTKVAGAIVDHTTPGRLRKAGFDPAAALAANDSFPGLRHIEAVVDTGPTGTNVNDLYFALRNDPP
jgi:glycerate 2-kinase